MIEMDKIYTNLSILRQVSESLAPIKIPLNSHNEIFTTQVNGMLPHRILVLGRGGSGKSTLIAKIAYDWSHDAANSSVSDIPLLFALNMRQMTKNTTLEEAILNQLLPKDTTITKESLSHYIENNVSDVMILLDSYDEFSRGVKLTSPNVENLYMQNILANNLLTSCRVLVTSRHWRESDFSDLQNIYAKMEVTGFTADNIRDYIKKYYHRSEKSGKQLYKYIESHNLFEIASCPLMTQLLCFFWKHNEGNAIPTRVGELYSAIFKIMYKHSQEKGIMQNSLHLEEMMVQLGEVAFRGLWPPENRLVFTLEEVKNIISDQCVEDGCKTGIISIEQEDKMSTFEQVMADNLEEGKSVVFFHKSGQEMCAGECLSNLASKDPDELKEKIIHLDTPEKCLSVQMILRFACGRSKKAAGLILHKLIEISKLIQDDLVAFYEDKLTDPSQVRLVQEFVEMCLLCNYESGSTGQFNSMLLELFPVQILQFFGMSPYTGMAVSHFLTWIQHKTAIDCIKITTLPQHGVVPKLGASNIVDHLHSETQQMFNLKSLAEIQNLYTEYISKNRDKLDLTEFKKEVGLDYSYGLNFIQMWEYFKPLQSSTRNMNVEQILSAVKYISLRKLDLTDTNLQSHGETLIATMEQGHMSFLTNLKLSNTHLYTQQLTHMVRILPQATPRLTVFDIGWNQVESPVIQQLSESLPALSVQKLHIESMEAPAEDMTSLAKRIPEFCSHLTCLRMAGNFINDAAGLTLVKTLPHANQLRDLSVDVDEMSRRVHKKLLMTISNLAQLHGVYLRDYPEDLMLCMADVMQSLSELDALYLTASLNTMASLESVLSRSTWKEFMCSLHTRAVQMTRLGLLDIRLHKEDLQDLVELCREHDMELM